MKRALPIFLVLLLVGCCSGCASAPGKPNRALPWNWFKPDAAARVEKFDAKIGATETNLLRVSQQLFLAAQRELEADPHPSLFMQRALGYQHRGADSLAQAVGPIAPEQARAVELMVTQRQSADPAEIAKGDKALAALDRVTADYSAQLAEMKQDRDAARQAEHTAYAKARIAEEKYDRMWFWIWSAIAGYVLIMWVLPLVARAFPGMKAAATIAQGLVAPFVTSAAAKTSRVLGDVVGGVEELRAKLKAAGTVTHDEASAILGQWVTEADGTAAHVDQVRREKGLL